MASDKSGLRKRHQACNVHRDQDDNKHEEKFKALHENSDIITCSVVGETTLSEGRNAEAKWEEHGRAEIEAAINVSLAEYDETCGSNIPAWRIVEGEYTLLCDQLATALDRDKKNQMYNTQTSRRRLCITMLGTIFLLCPMLVAYDVVLSKMMSTDQIWILQNAATIRTKQGSATSPIVRTCSHVVVAARAVGHADEHSSRAYTTGSLGALLLLLVVLRVTAKRKRIMTYAERKRAANLIRWVQDDLTRRREQRRQLNKIE